jgi:hypothetical protein
MVEWFLLRMLRLWWCFEGEVVGDKGKSDRFGIGRLVPALELFDLELKWDGAR